jgi:hypothetical protein
MCQICNYIQPLMKICIYVASLSSVYVSFDNAGCYVRLQQCRVWHDQNSLEFKLSMMEHAGAVACMDTVLRLSPFSYW